MERFKGKTALVTGAGSGIGREIAVRLSEWGIMCVLIGRREENLNCTAEMIHRNHGECLVYACDITKEEDQDKLIEKTLSVTGSIDLVINNAGVTLGCPFENVTMEQYDEVMDINVRAPFMLCRKCLPHLKDSS